MFEGFDIKKFKDQKPPSDNSFTTSQEIKDIAKNQIANFNKLENKLGTESASKTMASIITGILSDSSL